MAKPWIHAQSSAKKFGGIAEDYIDVHDFMDSSKAVFPDNRHRTLTHNSWFIFVVERVFGHNLYLSCSKCGARDSINDENVCLCGESSRQTASVRDVCEQHILEDYGNKYIPTPQDYLEHLEYQPWMSNGVEGAPSSHRKLAGTTGRAKRMIRFD